MEESETDKNKLYLQILHQDGLREDCGKDLRAMELQAYSNVMDVMRAEGTLDKEKKGVIDSLRKYFNISEARHIAECRRVNSNNKLLDMADRLQTGFDPEAADETWTVESYGVFPPLPSFQRRTSGYSRSSFSRTNLPVGGVGPTDELNDIVKTEDNVDFLKSVSDDVAALAEFKWHSKVKKVNKKVQTKVSTIHRNGIAGGSSDESDVKNERERSPDIIDAGSPFKKTSPRRGVVTKTTRGPKRKASMEQLVETSTGSRRLSNIESTRSAASTASSAKITKKMKFTKGFAKQKGKFPKIKFVKRPRQLSPELSSDDEDHDQNHHHHPGVVNKDDHPRALVGLSPNSSSSAINNTVENPTIRITSPPIRPVTTTTSRGRGSRMRGRGMFSRGRGRGRGVHTMSSQNLGYMPNRNDLAAGGSPPRHVMPISSPSKRSPATSPTKPLKASKPKKPKPVSLSRRKSRLKEKEDDDMQVEWNDYDDDALIISNKHFPKKRKLHPDELSHSDDGDMMENPFLRNHHGKLHLENGEAHNSKQIGGYVPHGYHHQHPHYHQNYLSPPNDTHHHHHVGGRDGSHLRSPQLSGEETDSASEKGSITGGSRTNESPGTNSSNANSPPPPPSRQKQRLKSPFTPSPQLPRINIPPPIFSTSLSSVQKKRPQKHISVVDSLNLHLPTTPTASSLASSARRESMPTGSSIFSNQAILARNAGGSPGILQTQRKATPHILSNSKTIQRTYVPTTSTTPSGVINSGGGMCVSVGGTTINLSATNPITSISSTAGGTTGVQVQTSVNIPNVISTSSGIIQIPSSSSGTIPMQMGTTTVTARPPGSSPIILVQKTNPSSNVPASAIQLQGNPMASKTGSRAVILRRTTQPQQQLPRSQGNVMFLDVQNKQVTNQIHPFLQPVSRILTAPSEMSVLNIQSGQPQRTLIQSPSPDQHHEPTVVFKSVTTPSMSHRKQKLVGSEVVFTTIPNHVQPGATIRIGQNDTQMAQIEAELLEMEQEIAYEEEVETSESVNNSVELPHQSIQFTIPTRNSASHSAISSTSVSGNSSAAANTYTAAGVSSNSTVKIINATYGGIPGENNAQNHNSQNMVANHEDIFSTALKSSGIVFTDQQFFDVEEICESNDTQQQQNSVDVINHIMLGNQENGSKQ